MKILCWLFFCVISVAACFLLFTKEYKGDPFADDYMRDAQTFYFPQIGIYIKVINSAESSNCYVAIGRDSILSLQENVDYIKFRKSRRVDFDLYFDCVDLKTIYYDSNQMKHLHINQVLFDFKELPTEYLSRDRILYEAIETEGQYLGSRVKPYFFEVNIGANGLTAVYTDYTRRQGPIIAIPIGTQK